MNIQKILLVPILVTQIISSVARAAPREPWLSVTPPPANDLFGVSFGNGLFVAVGSFGTILTSTDGASWTARTPGTNQVDLYAVTYGDHGFVAVGGTRESPHGQPVVWTSTNGLVWVTNDVSAMNLQWGNWFQGVTYGGGLYVAVGGNYTTNTVATSPDGVNWTMHDSTLINSGLTPLSCVAYGNGVFVAAGPWLITSPDGINWTEQNSSGWYRLYGMTFANGQFVGVGPYSRICSTNGTNWTVATPFTGDYIYGVAYGDGYYVCLGYHPAYTDTGTNWISQTNTTTGNAIAYGNSIFVAVDNGGKIYRTASAIHAQLAKPDTAQVTLTGLVPGTCRIYTSGNLADTNSWALRTTIALTNSPMTWIDSDATNASVRFYRAVWSP